MEVEQFQRMLDKLSGVYRGLLWVKDKKHSAWEASFKGKTIRVGQSESNDGQWILSIWDGKKPFAIATDLYASPGLALTYSVSKWATVKGKGKEEKMQTDLVKFARSLQALIARY